MTKLIVGLGNPGPKYEKTRHNIGFRIVEQLAAELGARFVETKKFQAQIAAISTPTGKILIMQPLTFMNASGEAVQAVKNFYRVESDQMLVVHDDIDLPLGKIKVSTGSGAAGHHGVESIFPALDPVKLTRLRLGIENRGSEDRILTEDYVLRNFTAEEEKKLEEEILPHALREIKKYFGLDLDNKK